MPSNDRKSHSLRSFLARHPKKLFAALLLVIGPLVAHGVITELTSIEPPPIRLPHGEQVYTKAERGPSVLGDAYARHRGKILEVRLVGTPEQIGHQHGQLLYSTMVENEGALYDDFRRYVPLAPVRWLIMDISRLKFRRVDQGMSDERRHEIAAQAAAFSPDPYADVLPTYHRFVFLQSLYDIALSFEHSPLLGCTSFALTDGAAEDGHVLVARNFDFEAGPIFDEKKAVFIVQEDGRIPYASVSWPGLVGVVTGMNALGLTLVVHGGRAREPRSEGEPVVHTMRELLGRAKTTSEAKALLETRAPLVSHIVMLADPSGDVAIVERAPGTPPFVRRGRGKVPLTNHFEGPLADDPRNLRVEKTTSTRARRARLDELLASLPEGASVERILGLLRDKKGVGNVELPLGHRRAIDALIATHSVVMDATARTLWVSEGPHLLGRYIRFDLGRLFVRGYTPPPDEPLVTLGEDEIRTNGAYDAFIRQGSPHRGEP